MKDSGQQADNLLYSSSQIFNRRRIDEKERQLKGEKERKQIFEGQFSLDQSQLLKSQDLKKEENSCNSSKNISYNIHNLNELQEAYLNCKNAQKKCTETELGQEEQKFMRKILLQKGYLNWSQHKAELHEVLETIHKKRNEKKTQPIKTQQTSGINNSERMNISFQKQSNIWVKNSQQSKKKSLNKQSLKNRRYYRYDTMEDELSEEENYENVHERYFYPNQRKVGNENQQSQSALYSQQQKKSQSDCEVMRKNSSLKKPKKIIKIQQQLSKILLPKNPYSSISDKKTLKSSVYCPYENSEIIESAQGVVQYVSHDHLYLHVGGMRFIFFFGLIDLVKMSQKYVAIHLKSGSLIKLVFQDGKNQMKFLEKMLAWTSSKSGMR